MSETEKKIFLTARTDGLGERLKAMLNAMVLAEYFDGEFRFQWNENITLRKGIHVVGARELTFSQAFLDAHHVESFVGRDYKPGGLKWPKGGARKGRMPAEFYKRTLADMQELLASAPKGLMINQEEMGRVYDFDILDDLTPRYQRAFERVTFVPHLMDAIVRARNIVLPEGAVALHLRAGDIINGAYRLFSSTSHKALCYPVAKHVVSELVKRGKYPLIFGQDMATCRLLADTFGVKLAVDFLGEDSDDLVMALGEIVLMSRCEEIVAGASGFSTVASWISGTTLTMPLNDLSPGDLYDLIMNDPDLDNPDVALPDLQRAFAYYSAAFAGMRVLGPKKIIEALDKALGYDPVNFFYALLKARLETQLGYIAKAEATLKFGLEASLQKRTLLRDTARRVVERVYSPVVDNVKMDISVFVNDIDANASPDRPYTTFVAAMAADMRNDPAYTLSLLDMIPNEVPGVPAWGPEVKRLRAKAQAALAPAEPA